MSNFNANANLAIDSQEDLLAKMKAINDSLIHNHSIQVEGDKEDDDTDYKDIAVTDEDAILTELLHNDNIDLDENNMIINPENDQIESRNDNDEK